MRVLIATVGIAGVIAFSGSATHGQYYYGQRSGDDSNHQQYHDQLEHRQYHDQLEHRQYHGQTNPYSQYNVYGSPYGSSVSPHQSYRPSTVYGSPSVRYYIAPYSYYSNPTYSRGSSVWRLPYSSYSSPFGGPFSYRW